jgi:hypothetical protein
MDIDIFGYKDKINLEDYLSGKKDELKKLKREISMLQEVKISASIRWGQLYSSDYSLAKDFQIKMNTKKVGGFRDCNGGYSIYRADYFPQFFFTVETKYPPLQVYVQHENFETDEKIVFLKIFSKVEDDDYNRGTIPRNEVNINQTLSFFKNQGVDNLLLKKLEKTMLNLIRK